MKKLELLIDVIYKNVWSRIMAAILFFHSTFREVAESYSDFQKSSNDAETTVRTTPVPMNYLDVINWSDLIYSLLNGLLLLLFFSLYMNERKKQKKTESEYDSTKESYDNIESKVQENLDTFRVEINKTNGHLIKAVNNHGSHIEQIRTYYLQCSDFEMEDENGEMIWASKDFPIAHLLTKKGETAIVNEETYNSVKKRRLEKQTIETLKKKVELLESMNTLQNNTIKEGIGDNGDKQKFDKAAKDINAELDERLKNVE